MRINLLETTRDPVLAGSRFGRKILQILLERLGDVANEPQEVFLDFDGIRVATASFLRESVIEFRDIVRRRWITYYPVVANANKSVVEELAVLVQSMGGVLVLCDLDQDGGIQSAFIMGQLEVKQQETYELVTSMKVAGAAELMKAAQHEEDISQSAWNNRLVALSKLGLLIESSDGRTKRYSPLPVLRRGK